MADIEFIDCDRSNPKNHIVSIRYLLDFNESTSFTQRTPCDPHGCLIRAMVLACLAGVAAGPVTTDALEEDGVGTVKVRWSTDGNAVDVTRVIGTGALETTSFPKSKYLNELRTLVSKIQACCSCGA